jgi:hypothetical protein
MVVERDRDGRFSIAVTFDIGTNLDIAQVQVQNRVGIAQPRLPADVRNIGVTVTKSSPDLMMVVHLFSPDQSRDALFISNYATLEIKDTLTRVDGVGSITVFRQPRLCDAHLARSGPAAVARHDGGRRDAGLAGAEYPGRFRRAQSAAGRQARRVPDRGADARPPRQSGRVLQHRGEADRRRRGAVEGCRAGPACRAGLFLQLLSGPQPGGRACDLPAPGSNALATADAIVKTMQDLSKRFPPGIRHAIVYNPTEFIRQSVNAVIETIGEAVILVVLVIIIFLQTWRAAVIPIVAIPSR